ncbi:hypothetical protein GCM10007939_01960 [Amylibacter marinus]|uniref:Putative Flp pilus-assembly TadG-like N-terminal domain-containing protein n=2 Tax=Amylibacter marinus TaxID=1475483 RepID=A0ABQ5VS26_9RHOB|nr:hypothetical protein GCM10007939_01960 [Amylibacter marinus]
MTLFVVLTFTTMIAFAGIAIDVARYEASRAEIQTHLDNATLAAASLRQTEDASVIVDRYMVAAGLDVKYDVVALNEVNSITYRHIEAQATSNMDTFFMHMFGVSDLDLVVRSAAQERVPHVEVSLVLDISGSMGNGGRLTNLKPAAVSFVTNLLDANDADNPNRVSISLIPYNMQVNAGETLFELVTGDENSDHDYSYCAEWDEQAFEETGFSVSRMDQAVHMGYSNSDDYTDTSGYGTTVGYLTSPYCRPETFAEITPWSKDLNALTTQINNLQARGNTSIDLGVKWGTALLDSSAQPVLTALAGMWETNAETGEVTATNRQAVDPGFIGRPVVSGDEVTLKVLVVMTDGQNTTQYRVKNSYTSNTANSPVWINRSTEAVSFNFESGSSWDRMSWTEMWGRVSVKGYTRRKGGKWWHFWDYHLNNSEKNDRLSDICAAAKDNQIIVFSIAYSASEDGQDALEDCATSSAYYHEGDPETIGGIFAEIGGVIEKLKLVQ